MKNPVHVTEAVNPIQNSLRPSSWRCRILITLLAFGIVCLAISPPARAVDEDCGDGLFRTALGCNALNGFVFGPGNTAVGWEALLNPTEGSYNTAVGFTAMGTGSDCGAPSHNTAIGAFALNANCGGLANTATGLQALLNNTTGNENTALGLNALFSNTTGSRNTALGAGAGGALTTGSDNIDIGTSGVAGESATIRIGTKGAHKNSYIAGIYGVTLGRTAASVFIDSAGHLGTKTSSARFKDQIKPMEKASEAILSLRPVTFRYKKELDRDATPQFGLVAEDVAKINRDLVVFDEEGKPYTVRYEAVNAMLLNEFLKEHRKMEQQAQINEQQEATIIQMKSTVAKQEALIAEQQKEIKALTASLKEQATQIQKVSAQLEMNKSTPQLVADAQ